MPTQDVSVCLHYKGDVGLHMGKIMPFAGQRRRRPPLPVEMATPPPPKWGRRAAAADRQAWHAAADPHVVGEQVSTYSSDIVIICRIAT